MINAMFSHEEPQTGPSSTLAWSVDVSNPNSPRALDGLARLLSLDMRVIDPAWIVHRYAMLGVLTDQGLPVQDMGLLDAPENAPGVNTMAGTTCPECGNRTVIHRDGCDVCTACGFVGQCG